MVLLEKIFAVLILYRHNMQCMHWNVVGHDYDSTHAIMDKYTSDINEMIDEIAEIIKMLGGKLMCLQECIDLVTKDEEHDFLYLDCSINYTSDVAFENVKNMFTGSLFTLYTTASDSNTLPSDVQSKIQEHTLYLRKEGSYKSVARR